LLLFLFLLLLLMLLDLYRWMVLCILVVSGKVLLWTGKCSVQGDGVLATACFFIFDWVRGEGGGGGRQQ